MGFEPHGNYMGIPASPGVLSAPRYSRLAHWIAGATLLTGICWLLEMGSADINLTRAIFFPERVWPGQNHPLWLFLYTWGPSPGLILGSVSLLLLVAGVFRASRRSGSRTALFYLFLLLLGPGLVVNVLLKDNLGRPRPREIAEFGGKYQYAPFWQAGEAGKNSSFPSGHASVAFYLMAPWFVYRKRNPSLARMFLAGGLVYGALVGTGRMLQGAHFATDIIGAGGIVYLTGELLSWKLLEPRLETQG